MEQQDSPVGIVYMDYNAARAAIDRMAEGDVRKLLGQSNIRIIDNVDLRTQAHSAVFSAFRDKTFANDAIWLGRPTLFDRDPRAIKVFDSYLEQIERETGGYAFEHDPEWVTSLVAISKDIAALAHNLPDVESFWAFCRALDHDNPFHFTEYGSGTAAEFLITALQANEIKDPELDTLRYLPRNAFEGRYGFVSVAEYENELKTGTGERSAMSRAAMQHRQAFGDACGPFDFQRAREKYKESRTCVYWGTRSFSNPTALNVKEKMAEGRPVSKGSQEAYREFAQKELDNGHSPYGYWFGPDGTVYAMQAFQDHDRWLGAHLGRRASLLREEALAEGWVSLTMANEFNADPNIGYNPASDCSQALKAAARVVRRGGDYLAMVIEAYDDNLTTLSYEQFDDLKQGVRRLNELSREVGPNYVAVPKP